MRVLIAPAELADARTGVPRLFEPVDELPDRPAPGEINVERIADEHHPAEGRATLLNGNLDDVAIRYSRTQWSLYDHHHHGWHKNNLRQQLPETAGGRLRYLAFLSAGCLTEKCVVFQRTRNGLLLPRIEKFTMAKREFMWERGDVKVEKPLPVNASITRIAIGIGTLALHTSFDEELVRRFKADPLEYTWPLARRVFEMACRATDLHRDYAGARKAGLLPVTAPLTAKLHLIECAEQYMANKPRKYGEFTLRNVTSLLLRQLNRAAIQQTDTGALLDQQR